MFARPADLPDALVLARVGEAWLPTVDSVAYTPVGFGSHHWTVSAGSERWFLTVDDLTRSHLGEDPGFRLRAALTTAHQLRADGLDFVVAPVATARGDLLVAIGERYLGALYPYIDGVSPEWGPYRDPGERLAVLDRLIDLHRAPRQALGAAIIDDCAIQDRDLLTEAMGDLDGSWDAGPFAERTRRLLGRRSDHIADQLDRYDRLVEEVAADTHRMVITHGEAHRGNTIVTAGGVVLVDWDTLLVAPPERDLWWLNGDDPSIEQTYRERTGVTVSRGGLDLYRLRWTLSDVAAFTGQFRSPHGDDEDTRTAWRSFEEIVADPG